MTDEVEKALENLEKIKNGDESVQTQTKTEPTSKSAETDALRIAESEVDRLFDEHAEVRRAIDRQNVHVGIARWKGRHGVAKYDRRLNKKKFGERMSSLPHARGEHALVLNERIMDQGNRDAYLDTVRHELAHIIVYAIHGTSQGHNHHWKAMASKLDADPSATGHTRDRSDEYQYYIICPECGYEGGKTKRSKVIKQPFNRKCGKCGASNMSSYEDGQEPPEEHGVVKVPSLPWDNKDEWWEHGAP